MRTRTLHLAVSLALLAASTLARAAEPAAAAPPPPTPTPATPPAPASQDTSDPWTVRIHQSLREEGGKTHAQLEQDAQDSDRLTRARARVRPFAFGGIGFGYVKHVYGEIDLEEPHGVVFSAGGGVRVGISALWQFQARGAVDFTSSSTACFAGGSGGYTFSCDSVTLLTPSVDATFRVHFTQASPIFFGFGPRVGAILAFASGSTHPFAGGSTPTSTTTTSTAETSGLLGIVTELGANIGQDESIEVAVRPFLGVQTAETLAVAASGGVSAGFAF